MRDVRCSIGSALDDLTSALRDLHRPEEVVPSEGRPSWIILASLATINLAEAVRMGEALYYFCERRHEYFIRRGPWMV